MTRTAASFALLVAALSLAAQSNQSPDAAPQVHSMPRETLVFVPGMEGPCPIAMHASQGVWDHTIRVKDGKKEPVPPLLGQLISLILRDSRTAHIVAATVRIRGWNGKNRWLLTPAGEQHEWNAVTTQKIKFVEENDGSFSADLRIAGFTAVSSVQLIDVLYADGTAWRTTDGNACRVRPDPLMLITER